MCYFSCLFRLVKGFFSELLKLDYEFTYEELSTELNKIFIKPTDKRNVDEFLSDLSEAEYSLEKDMAQDEIRDFLKRMQSIINFLISEEQAESKRTSFFEKMLSKKQEGPMQMPAIQAEVKDQKGSQSPDTVIDLEDKELPKMPEIGNVSVPDMSTAKNDSLAVERENYVLKQNMFLEDLQKLPRPGLDQEIPNNVNEILSNSKIPMQSQTLDVDMDSLSREPPVKKSEQKISKKQKQETKNIAKRSTDEKKGSDENILLIPKIDSLVVEDNKPEIVRLRELMEDSYFSINCLDTGKAKLSYLEALAVYHKLSYDDKKMVYQNLLGLFKKLKSL